MTPRLAKLNLTVHIVTSVGWIGAVISFLVLSIVGLTSRDPNTVRAMYIAMDLIGLYAIVPFGVAAFLSGILQSVGTAWGLFRYYWVIAKLALTIGALTLLLLHQFTAVSAAAKRATAVIESTTPDMGRLGIQLIADSGIAVVVLLVITVLGIYKPWGKTTSGKRAHQQSNEVARAASASSVPTGLKIFLAIGAGLLILFLGVHLAGGGLGNHGG